MDLMVLVTFAVSFLSSILSGMTGGGAGFIIMPYFLAIGISPVQAVATSKLQSLGISFGGIAGFKGKGLVSKTFIWPLLIITALSALFSSWQLRSINEVLLEKAMGGVLIILTPTLFINRETFKPGTRSRTMIGGGYFAFALFSLLQALLGAGLGSMLVVVLMFLFGLRALEAQATKRVAQAVQAVIMFVLLWLQQLIVMPHGIAGFLGAILGCMLGTKVAIKKGDKFVKIVLAITMFISGIALLWPRT